MIAPWVVAVPSILRYDAVPAQGQPPLVRVGDTRPWGAIDATGPGVATRPPSAMTLLFSDPERAGITVMAGPVARAREVLERLPTYCDLKEYQMQAARWSGFALLAGESAPLQGLVVRYGRWEPDARADELLDKVGWEKAEPKDRTN
jgi:hypothetical protein